MDWIDLISGTVEEISVWTWSFLCLNVQTVHICLTALEDYIQLASRQSLRCIHIHIPEICMAADSWGSYLKNMELFIKIWRHHSHCGCCFSLTVRPRFFLWGKQKLRKSLKRMHANMQTSACRIFFFFAGLRPRQYSQGHSSDLAVHSRNGIGTMVKPSRQYTDSRKLELTMGRAPSKGASDSTPSINTDELSTAKTKNLKLHWGAKTTRLGTALKGKAIVFALMCIGVRSVDDFPPNSSITKNQKTCRHMSHIMNNKSQPLQECLHQTGADTSKILTLESWHRMLTPANAHSSRRISIRHTKSRQNHQVPK